jgi:hypothetical protein
MMTKLQSLTVTRIGDFFYISSLNVGDLPSDSWSTRTHVAEDLTALFRHLEGHALRPDKESFAHLLHANAFKLENPK